MKNWLRTAIQRQLVMRSLKVAGIVGTLLVAINQGDALLGGELPAEALWKIPMIYLVPYCVSTYASVSAVLAKRAEQKLETDNLEGQHGTGL